jgi:protein-S-isoprenylcysteine O-methyltransferase Ste14
MATPDKSTPRPASAALLAWRPDTEARQHLVVIVLALIVPLLLRVSTQAPMPGDSLLAVLAIMLGFALVAGGLLLYAWWTHTAWVHRDGESWNQLWMFGQGPTAFSRHPPWLALIAMTLGQALITPSIWLCGYALLVLIGVNLLVRRDIEPRLEQRHGPDYAAYAQRVARWLPWNSMRRTLREIGELLRNSVR